MRTQRTTLSFLTESKSSAVGLSSMQRVAMTLLVMLLTTASVWAQVIIPTIYRLSLNANYQGGALTMVDVPISGPTTTYTLTQNDEPIRTDYIFVGWSKSSTGNVEYKTGDPVELTGNLTLYAIWSSSVTYNSLKYEIIGAGKKQVKVSRYIGEKPSGTLNIPATVPINGTEYSVTIIGNNAFEYCSSLESVTIPNSVTSIGNNAFQNCEKLQSVTIPNSVTSIGNEAFMDCGITSLTIGMNNIGSEFRDFSSLKSVTILDGVTSIGDEAFIGCSSLASVTIPNSVTSIGNNAFMNCSSLESFTIPNSVTSIGSFAFEHCDKLESFTIPNSVTSIGYGAFLTSGLTSLTIGMENIGSGFQEIKKLKSITILDGVKSIGNEAFKNCSSLESVTIPNSVTSIGSFAFENCDGLESITIPNSVTSIGYCAFQNCKELTSITLNGNPRIGADAFSDATVTMNLTASQIGNDYWTTFYNDNWEYNFEADGNTTVYKGTVNESSLMLTEVEDKIVNSGTAVILKSSGKPVMTLTKSGSSDTNDNDLRGFSDRTLRTNAMTWNGANEIYTMGKTSAGFGFHRYTGEYVPAGKAFLPLNTSDGAKAQSLTIVFAIGSTGIKSVSSDSNVQNDWFSLDGTRLSGKPSQPGIYVNGKKKVVIK